MEIQIKRVLGSYVFICAESYDQNIGCPGRMELVSDQPYVVVCYAGKCYFFICKKIHDFNETIWQAWVAQHLNLGERWEKFERKNWIDFNRTSVMELFMQK